MVVKKNKSIENETVEEQLARQVEEWLNIPVGSPEAAKEAEAFYWGNIFPLTSKAFQKRECNKLQDKDYFGLILTVGTSPEPLILSINACQPQRVLFLHTPQTEKYLDQIIELTGLKISQIDKYMVKGADPLLIYQIVMKTWENWGRRKNIAVDITGGTKAMTGGLAMAGALLGFQLLYVASDDFLSERRRPRPGSEYLVLLPNPYAVFGSLQEKEAEELFKRKDYHGSSKALSELVEKVPDPRKFEVLYSLARAYEEWDLLNIKEAIANFSNVTKSLNKIASAGDGVELADKIEMQREKLAHLANLMSEKPGEKVLPLLQDKEAVETLVFTIYHNAQRMALHGKYDMASLYLYRLLEIFEQRRFALYEIDTSSPCYDLLPGLNPEMLLQKVNQLRENNKQQHFKKLPSVISLTDGYMILEVIGDLFQLGKTSPKPVHWRWFVNEIQKRNYSILAHGFIFVSGEQYQQFKSMVDSIFELFCLVEGIDQKRAFEQYHFIENPFDKHYFC